MLTSKAYAFLILFRTDFLCSLIDDELIGLLPCTTLVIHTEIEMKKVFKKCKDKLEKQTGVKVLVASTFFFV